MNWTEDDAGDLINLDLMESVSLNPLSEEQGAPEGATHELVAINADNESYRLAAGTEAECKMARNLLKERLMK